ncbi:MerR family transcriptional regulator [Paucibacter sp. TC2R-5]|uniref:MerR family transcriptional regulator n=1 Tax=Paucibacter sp. TC2R-5 TaxID=2893555 RepID=UPI0021E4C89D|nr:MerR family transcriptional regulator [Paucibacter sp. TC2R-5]MCV2358883.1 MerR family transcriptional regulator [Paucibacter sp. TC2R-5]
MENSLPAIPAKRYFTIGEVSDLCGVKPYVLRYWEQEFSQLKPMKRRGNRRYYQHHEVLLIRRIRGLLYDQGFTISGARNQLIEGNSPLTEDEVRPSVAAGSLSFPNALEAAGAGEDEIGDERALLGLPACSPVKLSLDQVRGELISIRELLLSSDVKFAL